MQEEIRTEEPLYIQIATELRKNIQDGIYGLGERIPTEENLAMRFGVNRHTLRRAVGMLSAEGLLRVDQGRGTFVSAAPIRYPIGDRVRYNASLKAQGFEPGYRLLRVTTTPATVRVAEALQIQTGEPVAQSERLGLADGWPVKIASSFFPLSCFPDIVLYLEQVSSLSQLFRDVYHRDHLRRRTSISAQMPTPEDARILQLPMNQPILLVEAINADQHGTIIEYGITRFRSDRTELVIEPGH